MSTPFFVRLVPDILKRAGVIDVKAISSHSDSTVKTCLNWVRISRALDSVKCTQRFLRLNQYYLFQPLTYRNQQMRHP